MRKNKHHVPTHTPAAAAPLPLARAMTIRWVFLSLSLTLLRDPHPIKHFAIRNNAALKATCGVVPAPVRGARESTTALGCGWFSLSLSVFSVVVFRLRRPRRHLPRCSCQRRKLPYRFLLSSFVFCLRHKSAEYMSAGPVYSFLRLTCVSHIFIAHPPARLPVSHCRDRSRTRRQ